MELDTLQHHIQEKHNKGNTVTIAVRLFAETNDPPSASVASVHLIEGSDGRSSEGEDSGETHEGEDSVGAGDGEDSGGTGDGDGEDSGAGGQDDSDSGVAGGDDDSASDVPNTQLFFSRGRQARTRSQVRMTPYSRSPSEGARRAHPLVRRPSEGSLIGLPPLQISLPLSHSPATVAPSPLAQLAFSRPNSKSPTKSLSDDDARMDVDLPDFAAEQAMILDMASLKVIPLIYLRMLPVALLVVCTQCEIALTSNGAVTHSKATHSIVLTKDQKRRVNEVLSQPGIIKSPGETTPPKPPCPPIEGLELLQGVSCDLCDYCCIVHDSFKHHFSREHRAAPGDARSNCTSATVQVFSLQNRKYFAVMPVLSGKQEENLFTAYLQQYAPQISALQLINPPLDHLEVPPLLVVTGWHTHLAPYMGDRMKVRLLCELTKLPTSTQGVAWMGVGLRKTIEAYLKDTTKKGNDADLEIRCVLMEYPRLGLAFHPLKGQRPLIHPLSIGSRRGLTSGSLFQRKQLRSIRVSFTSGRTPSCSPWKAMLRAIHFH